MNPKISVVVIGYNIHNYIEKCLDSILCQSFKEFEVIFVNDGSTDETLNIVSKYSKEIQIINKKNGGIVSARKAGVKAAKGEYVTFVDGDDWVNVDFLKNMYDPIKQYKTADIVCTDGYFEDADGNFVTAKNNVLNYIHTIDNEFFEGIMQETIDHHMFPKLYKTSFVINSGYLNYPEVTMAEDWITNAFFALNKPEVVYASTTNYFYRFNRSSVSRKGDKKILEQIKTLNYMEAYFRENCTFEYHDLLEYAWFSYVRTYLLANTESNVKKEIIKALNDKHYNVNSNPYCIKSIDKLGKKTKLKLKLEMTIPSLIPLFDCGYELIKKVINEHHIRSNKKYEKNLDELYNSYLSKLSQDLNKKIIVIGTSDRSNIGDHAIAYSEIKLLGEIFPDYSIHEITGDTFRTKRNELKTIIRVKDVLCITGGGFLGDLWPDEEYMVNSVLNDYPDNTVIILPQTIFFYDDADSPDLRLKLKNYTNHNNLYLTARDKKTFDFYSRYFTEDRIGLFPDMALYLSGYSNNSSLNDVMICLRNDKERVISIDEEKLLVQKLEAKGFNVTYGSTLADGVHYGDIVLEKRDSAILEKITEFSKPKFIITDRLHGMVLATLAGTPCIVFDNLSKKVSGVYELWLKNIDSIFLKDDILDIDKSIESASQKGHFTYSPDYLKEQKDLFTEFLVNAIGE